MNSITLFGVELLPYTWPLLIGVPSFFVLAILVGIVYELVQGTKENH